MRRAVLAFAVVAAGALVAAPAQARPLVVVQANVGNIDGGCVGQVFKLCLRPVERRAARALRRLHPDIVGFEEILPERTCRDHPSTTPTNLCSSPRAAGQPARLLGRGYRVTCARRFGYECLAVRRGSGVRTTKLSTRPVLPSCADPGFTVDRATLRVGAQRRRVALLLAHPDSMHPRCRAAQLRDGFATLPRRGAVLALGDFNLDPYREHDAGVRVFTRARRRLHLRLATGRRVSLRPGSSMGDTTGVARDRPPRPDFPPAYTDRTIDHVLVRGWSGSCRVRRIDGGGGMDHRAQVCRLALRD